jgi:dTDP-4-dehydrorhamnose reductase
LRILITGANGQLGHDLVDAMTGEDLHAFDHAALDVADAAAVDATVDRIKPDWILNAAAFNDVDGAEAQPAAAFAVNAAGPAQLAAAAARVGARMIHVSTDYVFDGRKGSAYDENDRANPLSVYARSKYDGEQAVLLSGASACVLRTAWLYGRQGKNFVKAIQAAAAKGGPLKVVADQVGSPTATGDLANAMVELMRTPASGLYHVVNAGACSRFEFARAIVGDQVEVLPISTAAAARPAPRPQNSALTSIRWASTGIPPLRSWKAALEAYLHLDRDAEPYI